MPAPRHYSRWRGVFRLALLPLCALAVGLRCDDRAQLALATMAWSDDEGYVHVQAIRDTGQMLGGDCNGHVMGEAEEELGGIGGWVEVWQEGHRLLLNSTEDEVRFELPEGVDTYMWASVFDHLGRWEILIDHLVANVEMRILFWRETYGRHHMRLCGRGTLCLMLK